MTLPALTISTALSFLFLAAVFVPLEMAFPAKPGQRIFRPAWWVDACFFVGQYLLWSGVVFWLLTRFGGWMDGWIPAHFRRAVAGQSWWLQAIEVVILSDFFIYWGHRLQ